MEGVTTMAGEDPCTYLRLAPELAVAVTDRLAQQDARDVWRVHGVGVGCALGEAGPPRRAPTPGEAGSPPDPLHVT
ncbi:MAG: hypothetical protein ACREN5_09890, partial [Gemmatimonadales bacterium]